LIDNCEFLSCDAMREQWRIWKRLRDDGQFDGAADSTGQRNTL